MTKKLVFDSGPVISLTINNLLWLLTPLKAQLRGDFYITSTVRKELIDQPLHTKKYKFEALQVLPYITNDIIKVIDKEEINKKALALLDIANTCFEAKGSWVKNVHYAEMQTIAAAIALEADAVVIDERVTRMLIENPRKLAKSLEKRLHTPIRVNEANINLLREKTKGIRFIRSAELVTVAYELGLLNTYIVEKEKTEIPELNKALLEGVLWALKLNGCAISIEEIEDLIRIETKR